MSSFKHVLVLLKWCLLYYLHLTWSVLEQMDAQQGCSVGTLEHLGCVQGNNSLKLFMHCLYKQVDQFFFCSESCLNHSKMQECLMKG